MTKRRTISLPEVVDDLISERAEREGSYSAAVVALVTAGARRVGIAAAPAYVGSGSGPGDLGREAERYLRLAARRHR